VEGGPKRNTRWQARGISPAAGEAIVIRRILQEKNFIACALAAITGIVLYFRYPFPEGNFFLELIFLWARPVFQGLKFSYTLFLYTTPYIVYSILLSAIYIFTLKTPPRPKAGKPPAYPTTSNRNNLFLVLGEVHNPRTPEPSETPYWLTIPERGLFTGIAVFGAVGSGKTSAALYPYAEQILSYEAANPEKRIGGLVLEVKGDFCRKVRAILARFDGCALKATAKQLVFSDGNPKSRLMFVGEAPGREEDIEGLPFVGRSGQLLNRMIAAIGLDRSKAYIANVIPWRPPGNRTPTPQETQICLPFIQRQIELVNPDVLVTLGNPSTQTLLSTREGIMKTRGKWFDYDTGTRTIRAIATFHPAYLLRSPSYKRMSWQDLRAIAKALGN